MGRSTASYYERGESRIEKVFSIAMPCSYQTPVNRDTCRWPFIAAGPSTKTVFRRCGANLPITPLTKFAIRPLRCIVSLGPCAPSLNLYDFILGEGGGGFPVGHNLHGR